ncbi:MAG TPA: hypothetical protein PKG60_08795 [Spirochaetota bacterium]|nr:hypothetical protein [Spirochaetota bacterium]HPS86187.1 hypothetical protein [Spirochaetota bacterium]
MSEEIISEKITEDLKKISPFIDYASFTRVINKLTDYAEIITEGKLASLINFNYRLNASQANMVIDLLVDIQALSKIYAIAQKGKRDLDLEYISNIFSDVNNPGSISSYLSLRNVIENRLSHQVQQYNMNMGKNNTTMSIPLNELHGHVKTYKDLMNSNITISHKAGHGFIAASLHDAYLTILNRFDWWNDKTYIKFFFNEDNSPKKSLNLITRETRLTLFEIDNNVKKVLDYLQSISLFKTKPKVPEQDFNLSESDSDSKTLKREGHTLNYSDKLLLTPFGVQYGQKIDEIIDSIFNGEKIREAESISTEDIRKKVTTLYQVYKALPGSLAMRQNLLMAMDIVYYMLGQDYGIKKFTEEFIYIDRKIPFLRFFPEVKDDIEEFLTRLFIIFFEEVFSSIFKIIRSLDMKQYACAFIIKRIYLIKGEEMPVFGYFLIKAIARHGKIKVT